MSLFSERRFQLWYHHVNFESNRQTRIYCYNNCCSRTHALSTCSSHPNMYILVLYRHPMLPHTPPVTSLVGYRTSYLSIHIHDCVHVCIFFRSVSRRSRILASISSTLISWKWTLTFWLWLCSIYLLISSHYLLLQRYYYISRAWCKTIVTTSFYIRTYNSFAPSPRIFCTGFTFTGTPNIHVFSCM